MKKLVAHTLSRREALAALGALAVSSQVPWGAAKAEAAAKPQMAIQLYTMRNPAKKDLPGTLKKIREMGWKYVQWSGMPGLPAEKIREALDEADLKAISCHCGVEPFEKDFDKEVAFWKTVGVTYAGPGGMMGDCKKTLKDWVRGAKRMDAVGAKLRGEGIQLMYHNHASEFESFPDDPRSKEDILLAETDPKNLVAELDIAWVQVGGVDPAAYIRKCKGRCPHVHAKDLAPKKEGEKGTKFTPLGQGIIDWDEVFAAGREAGIKWYTYEQDNGAGDPFDYAAASYEFLAKKLA